MQIMNKVGNVDVSFGEGWKSDPLREMRRRTGTWSGGTPRPIPQARFFQEQLSFSTKKEKSTPREALPPRPPVKSVPPVSRIFSNRGETSAKPISFKSQQTYCRTVSPLYNAGSKELYFDQCFEIQSKLGAGSFGEVFKVRSKEDGRFYAVKRSKERFKGECDRKRKLEEVAKHEALRHHPNCIKFYKAWEEKRHLYIQTELCQTSLKALSDQNHNIPERLIQNYMVDLLMAVKHLHDSDLVHMDIKPENIFISDAGVCKLGDFGLVIDVSSQVDHSEDQEGDPKYLAPELLQGQYGKPADLFSLGMTFLELASDLDLPRGGELWHQLRHKHIPAHLLANLSPQLKLIIKSMLEPDPVLRPTVDQLLSQPFIKQIWKKRKREQLYRNLTGAVLFCVRQLWSVMLTLWLILMHPLSSLIPVRIQTPRKYQGVAHPQDWDHSYSEDEIGHEDSINHSMDCAPLDFSTSSDDSLRDAGLSTSAYQRLCSHTPRLNSTRLSDTSLSPFSSPCPRSVSALGKSATPNTSFQRSLLLDGPQNNGDLADQNDSKSSIEPKNLMDAQSRALISTDG